MQISHALVFRDFESKWYKYWAKKLHQTNKGKGNFDIRANKFWQNAVITEALFERKLLTKSKLGLGFGVGMERLPALFASLGVSVTATDQNPNTVDATKWSNDQLAYSLKSLNLEGICPPKLFEENVTFRPLDMNKIPYDLRKEHFDFLWSNCALGHIGSIEKSLNFIDQSMNCLKPGGWAIHTTEANILSNEKTLDNSDTVFFRQKDLLGLFEGLARKGYVTSPLNFNLGRSSDDKRLTLAPKWGNDYSKILFNGHLATQIVLIIHKPKKHTFYTSFLQILRHRIQYFINLLHMKVFMFINRELAMLVKSSRNSVMTPAIDMQLIPSKKHLKLKMKHGERRKITLSYTNSSNSGLFKIHNRLDDVNPIAVATADPINRSSIFIDKSWYEPNRPLISIFMQQGDTTIWREVDYVPPHKNFTIQFWLNAEGVKSGIYKECFCLVKEFDDIIPFSEINAIIEIV